MADIITGTPPDLTYGHWLVQEAWMVVWAITSAALVVILGWMGLSFIMAEHLGRQHAGWREMVPRLVLGLVAAASSLWWCALVLDVADAVSGFIAFSLGVTPGDMLRSTLSTLMTAVQAGSVGMALLLAVLYLVYGLRSENASFRSKLSMLSLTLRMRHRSLAPFLTPRRPLPIIWK